jgi:hypothetical protein
MTKRTAWSSTLSPGKGFKRPTLAEAIKKQLEKRGRKVTIVKASEAKEYIERSRLPAKGKSDKQKAKAKADKWFSMFIRLRDSDENGIATCITSGRRMYWREGDCGHYLSRAKEATRYDERNCHFQSKQANRFQGGHFMEHGFRIEEKYGRGTCRELELKAMQPCRRTTSDYLFLADCYQKKVELIAQMEPGKFKP